MSVLSPPQRTGRNVALIVSLCVNLLLAGILAMAVFRLTIHLPMLGVNKTIGWSTGGFAPLATPIERQQVRQLMSPRVLMRVAPVKKDALRTVTKPHHDELDSLRDATNEARREVVRLYTAPNFDKAAFAAALAHMQRADTAFEIATLKVAAETGAVLSPEERKAVIAWQPPPGFYNPGMGRQGHGPNDRPPQPQGDGASQPPNNH